MIAFIDNYDSFSYMLVDYLKQLSVQPTVMRNDAWTIDQLKDANPEAIIISPGPETPQKSGMVMEAIDTFHQYIPILGICLGHQALGTYFGADLVRSGSPVHGKTATVYHNTTAIFTGIPNPFTVMRYHSLTLENIPPSLEVSAHTANGIVMALQHRSLPLTGFQFHPESILTDTGLRLLQNWVSLYIANENRVM